MNKLKTLCVALLCVLILLGCVPATIASPITDPTTLPTVNDTIATEPTIQETTPTIRPTVPEETKPTPTPPETTPPTESSVTEPPVEEPPATQPDTNPEVEVKPDHTPEQKPTPDVTYTEVNETVYAVASVNVRTGPGTEYQKVGSLKPDESITRIGIGKNGWSKVIYNGEDCYIKSSYLTQNKPLTYPITYSDSTCTITITREWHYNAWCYIAHIQFTDYSRLASAVAKNNRGSFETTSSATKRQDAILCVNGPYNWGELKNAYAIIRNGVVFNDIKIEKDLGIYNANTGILMRAEQLGINGMLASDAAAAGLATDTFKFWNSTLVLDGQNISNPDNSGRAQRTFIATNGKPGDIYIIVAEGRKVDGVSPGLTKWECAKVVLDLDCTYGVMLDGGGSSTMCFNGKVLNSAAGNERAVVDFLYFKKE